MQVAAILMTLAVSLPHPALFIEDLPRASINNNTNAAGRASGTVQQLSITIGRTRWFPEDERGPSVEALAFGETPRTLSIPGPLIRTTAGTRVRVILSNPLRDTLTVFGLHNRPGEAVPVHVAPGARQTVEFSAPVGTYFYWGTIRGSSLDTRQADESQLSGAIVIDDPAALRRDRILMIGVRIEPPDSIAGVLREHEALVINGKSWPHTERMKLVQGDTVFWRVLNASPPAHPMHLHGFYFRVDSRGTWRADTVYTDRERRQAATELMYRGSTYTMTFVPTEPGNWLFHCHFAFHVAPDRSLATLTRPANPPHDHAGGKQHMAGLVIGLTVAPRGPRPAALPQPKEVRLFVNAAPRRFGAKPGYSFVLQSDGVAPKDDSVRVMSSPLFLTRGERVRIKVTNRLPQPTAIHWHGIELESFPDGVPDWSGSADRLFTNVPAKDSFDAVFTPPRAGTFIYHSHLNEGEQIISGLFGPLIVLDPGEKFDSDRERVFVVGAAGPIEENANDMGTVNGEREPGLVDLVAGRTYRFRLININPEWRVQFTIGSDTSVVAWRPIAKDGADLPEWQRTLRPAFLLTGPGETADFEFTPEKPGDLQMNIRTRVSGWNIPVLLRVRPDATPGK
jgi:FtsP/CotA-like multicopper oxidase with cupredoxin domain